MVRRGAFTLIEVLISIALMGIVIVALFSSVDLLQHSNKHLLHYLKKTQTVTKANKTLYLDLLSSDGNITIQKDQFSRVCINETRNSLYALPSAKVCWVVLKKEKTLLRVEGNAYDLPLQNDVHVEVDEIMKGVSLFDVYHEKDNILVLLQQEEKEPISFMVQGVSRPEVKKKTVKQGKGSTSVKEKAKEAPAPTPLVPLL